MPLLQNLRSHRSAPQHREASVSAAPQPCLQHREASVMAALGLDKGGPVQSDGSFLVSRTEYCGMAALMNHEERYFHAENRKSYIRRYLIKRPIGFAILLGSSRYDASAQPMKCVEKDLESMRMVLEEGGWEVDTPYGCNVDREGYDTIERELRGRDLKKYSCFMFYFSGHGSLEGMLLEPDGDPVPFKDVIDMVLRLEDFQRKPKILIFDCCRGNDAACEDEGASRSFKSLGDHFASKYHDMIVCFACTKNATSVAAHENGSIFTQNFAKKLQWFGSGMSFVDLLTQAMGETFHVVKSMFKMDQQPVSYCGLNAQLLLRETQLSPADQERAKTTPYPIVLVPVNYQPEKKGPYNRGSSQPAAPPPDIPAPLSPPNAPMDTSPPPQSDPVMKDHVTAVTRKFTTKQDVVANVGTLGSGQHVFLCYLPDPLSPYDHPDPTRVRANVNQISRLHHDLTTHGFVVTSDLGLGDQQPMSTLEWYVRHIELCDHVILVCSPAFKELFTSSRPQRPVTDPKARRFLCYSAAIYAECDRSVESGVSKFIPVVLDPQWLNFDQSVPLLFRGSHIYQLFEEHPRRFDYDKKEGHFEQLVCRMVGINRAEIDASQPGPPIIFNSSSIEDVNRKRILAQARFPQRGYVTRPSSVGRQPASEQCAWRQAWANVTPTEQPRHYATANHTVQTAGDVNRRMYLAQHQSGNQMVNAHLVRGPTSTVPVGVQPRAGEALPHIQTHPPPLGPAPTSGLPDSDPSALPLTPPPPGLLLWLSDEVVQWKFLGRYLGMEEPTIERIALEDPNNIREQCFQMLKTFERQQGAECTCRRLGEALLQSEKNRHLFGKFCGKLRELSSE